MRKETSEVIIRNLDEKQAELLQAKLKGNVFTTPFTSLPRGAVVEVNHPDPEQLFPIFYEAIETACADLDGQLELCRDCFYDLTDGAFDLPQVFTDVKGTYKELDRMESRVDDIYPMIERVRRLTQKLEKVALKQKMAAIKRATKEK